MKSLGLRALAKNMRIVSCQWWALYMTSTIPIRCLRPTPRTMPCRAARMTSSRSLLLTRRPSRFHHPRAKNRKTTKLVYGRTVRNSMVPLPCSLPRSTIASWPAALSIQPPSNRKPSTSTPERPSPTALSFQASTSRPFWARKSTLTAI